MDGYQYILINNNKIEVLYKGNKGPLFVILTGMGCSFDEWYEIINILSQTNRVLTFHRQGLGKSEIGEGVKNTESTVRVLASLLDHFKIEEPIYLIGHSYGGLCAQHFAKSYSKIVAGVILVDSTSIELKELDNLNLPVIDQETDKDWIEKCLNYALKDLKQLSKILNPTLNDKHRQLPIDIQQRLLDFQINPSLYKAMASEIKEWKKDAEVIKNLGDFPDIPLIVIGRDKDFTIKSELKTGTPLWELRVFEDKWSQLITNQVKLSSKSELLFASNSGHSVFLDRPDLIIECVHRISSEHHK
ncbi:alpha/beta fold hydrolase [Gottfriedia acidiceleris]|uniref:alpha/beta fold hydrolase n=1 Tax=Gottfriedia acidiceleris TaxID=371036 RepID=UPI000B43E655|nr:alpha/beta hydrolase [Gottfriedia acidiceleris]